MTRWTRRFIWCAIAWLIGIGLLVAPVSGALDRLFEVVGIALIFFALGVVLGMPGPGKEGREAH